MRASVIAAAVLALWLLLPAGASSAEGLRFWNLTKNTIVELDLAKPGSNAWGANQCLNDSDKSVDPDERLALTGVTPGPYDVKLVDKAGRRCTLRNVELKGEGRYAFSIGEDDLKNCEK